MPVEILELYLQIVPQVKHEITFSGLN